MSAVGLVVSLEAKCARQHDSWLRRQLYPDRRRELHFFGEWVDRQFAIHSDTPTKWAAVTSISYPRYVIVKSADEELETHGRSPSSSSRIRLVISNSFQRPQTRVVG